MLCSICGIDISDVKVKDLVPYLNGFAHRNEVIEESYKLKGGHPFDIILETYKEKLSYIELDEMKKSTVLSFLVTGADNKLINNTALFYFHFLMMQSRGIMRVKNPPTNLTTDFLTYLLNDQSETGFKCHIFSKQWDFDQLPYKFSGVIFVLDSKKTEWETNKDGISNFVEKYNLTKDSDIRFQIYLDNMHLPVNERISSFEIATHLVDIGLRKNVAVSSVNIIEISCLQAVNDLAENIKTGKLDPKDRPQSIQRIIQSFQMLIREILIRELRKRSARERSESEVVAIPKSEKKKAVLSSKLFCIYCRGVLDLKDQDLVKDQAHNSCKDEIEKYLNL